MGEVPKPSLHGLSTEQRKYVQFLEDFAGTRSIAVARNNKFPNWNVDRWISVLTFLFVIVGGIWFAGGQWQGMKNGMEAMQKQIATLVDAMHRLEGQQIESREQIESIQRADEYYRTHPRTTPRLEPQ